MAENQTNSAIFPLAAALVLGTATIAGAWFFQLVIGLVPCPMCFNQRWPYYIGLPIVLIALWMIKNSNRNIALVCIAAAAVLFFGNGVYAAYHSGVEWRLWAGPAGCSGGQDLSASVGNLLADLKTAKVVSCVDAAWRFLGLSLAGYNVIISTVLGILCGVAFFRLKNSQGSSSISQ